MENITLSERSQTQKLAFDMIPVIENISRLGKSTETERKLVVLKDWAEEGRDSDC